MKTSSSNTWTYRTRTRCTCRTRCTIRSTIIATIRIARIERSTRWMMSSRRTILKIITAIVSTYPNEQPKASTSNTCPPINTIDYWLVKAIILATNQACQAPSKVTKASRSSIICMSKRMRKARHYCIITLTTVNLAGTCNSTTNSLSTSWIMIFRTQIHLTAWSMGTTSTILVVPMMIIRRSMMRIRLSSTTKSNKTTSIYDLTQEILATMTMKVAIST